MNKIENKQNFISKDEQIITKFFAYGIKDLHTINEILELSKSESLISKSLERAINQYYLQEKPNSERELIQETLEIFLHHGDELMSDRIKRNSATLSRFGSLDLQVGRMSASKIDFSKKEWLVFERWARFDPLTTILTLIVWSIIYTIIIYYIYLR